MPSEFYRIDLAAGVVYPLDLDGARQVVFQAQTNPVIISNDASFNEYFSVFVTAAGATNFTLKVDSDDKRLYAQSGGAAILEVWVIK